MTTETIGFGGDDPGTILPSDPQPPSRIGRTTVLAAVLVIAIVGAAIGVIVSRAGGGGSSQRAASEKLIPSTAFAVGTLDLSDTTGLQHTLDIANLFPGSPTITAKGDARTRLIDAVLSGTHDPHVTAADVNPWLGDVLVVAGYLDSAGNPQAEGLIAETDDAKATAFFKRVTASSPTDNYYEVHDGFVVFGNDKATVDGALALAAKKPLAGNGSYDSDVSGRTGDALAFAWADGKQLLNLAKSEASRTGQNVPQLGMLFDTLDKQAGNARAVADLRVTDKAAHLDVHVLGATPSSTGTVPSDELKRLPSGTNAGLAFAAGSGGQGFFGGIESSPELPQVQQAIRQATGLDYPKDAETLIGKGLEVSVGSVAGGTPKVALETFPTDMTAAKADATTLLDHAHGLLPIPIVEHNDDTRLVLATDDDLAQAVLDGKGGFGSAPGFAAALENLPASVTTAGYVDLSAYLPLIPDVPPALTHLKGLGFWSDSSGGELTVTFG